MYTPIMSWAKRNKKTIEGYTVIQVPEHPKAFKGWCYEHRLVVESQIGRILEDWETVHHINQDKTDNSPRNLFPCIRCQHDKAHRAKEVNG